jgi:hypothetical protein
MKSQYGRVVIIDGLTDASVQKGGNRKIRVQHQTANEIWFIGMAFENADALLQILILTGQLRLLVPRAEPAGRLQRIGNRGAA